MFDFCENLVCNVEKKQFSWNPVSRMELECEYIDGKRYYWVPIEKSIPPKALGLYKSVTTIISEKSDRTWLKAWVDRVGQEEADRITAIACTRGTAIHEMAEKYLRGGDYWNGHTTINIVDFNRVVPILNNSASGIYGAELPLFSHHLKTAGRADLACQWDGINSIVDFKTARREKLKEQITDYFIQSATYAIMFDEIYQLTTPQIVVIILVDFEDEPRVFIEKVDDWKAKVEEYFCDRQDQVLGT